MVTMPAFLREPIKLKDGDEVVAVGFLFEAYWSESGSLSSERAISLLLLTKSLWLVTGLAYQSAN